MVTARAASRNWGSVLGFGLSGVALGLALAGWGGSPSPPSLSAQGAPAVPAAGLIAMTAETPGNPNGSLLYLIDPKEQSFALYRIDGLKGTVKLEAARHFRGDLKLAEYNNQPPTVAAVEAMVSAPRGGTIPRDH